MYPAFRCSGSKLLALMMSADGLTYQVNVLEAI